MSVLGYPARLVAGELQRAVYTRLTGDQVLSAMAPVFDHVPEDATRPYVTLGEAIETPVGAHDRYGRSVLLVLHVWSDQDGMTEATTIANRLVELLDHQAEELEVAGHRVVSARFVDAAPQRDPDQRIRHVPVRFRVQTEQQQA